METRWMKYFVFLRGNADVWSIVAQQLTSLAFAPDFREDDGASSILRSSFMMTSLTDEASTGFCNCEQFLSHLIHENLVVNCF